jgi:hypothetical protein
MTNVAIFPEAADAAGTRYLAISGKRHFVGQTAGQALDGLAAQLNDAEKQTLVIVRHLAPDEFFTREQCRRLEELMGRWRAARDGHLSPLSADEQVELDALVEAEIRAAGTRAAAKGLEAAAS